jgi:hypothetical protein
MILEDFVMLGTTVPEPQLKTGRVFVCAAGYSHEMRRLVRIYPLARKDCPPRWSINRVGLERNAQDSRAESWKIRGDRTPSAHFRINSQFHPMGSVAGHERATIIQSMLSPSIAQANRDRQSLAVIEPVLPPHLMFEENPESPDHPQLLLFDDDRVEHPPEGSARFAFQPYLEFSDADGPHRLQAREWGAYEYMRKHGDPRRHDLADIWRLNDRPCLFVGNMSNHRTAWLVISVLMPLRQLQLGLEPAPRAAVNDRSAAP